MSLSTPDLDLELFTEEETSQPPACEHPDHDSEEAHEGAAAYFISHPTCGKNKLYCASFVEFPLTFDWITCAHCPKRKGKLRPRNEFLVTPIE